jgi:hypothetical protein
MGEEPVEKVNAPGLPPGFVEVAPGVFQGPRSKVGPGVYRGLVQVRTDCAGEVPGDDHDCDMMGCSSVEHVLSREDLAGFNGGPYTADEYEARLRFASPAVTRG